MQHFKSFFLSSLVLSALFLSACSTNPATGKQQFAALMSPQQEVNVGATEHKKVIQQFGLVQNPKLSAYVSKVGQRVTANTERSEVQYKFFVIDSPIVNAFALPGGYIYISRGLLALAKNEAELASVLGHEAGHITGRHSAERYSRGVVTSLGAGLLSAALGSQGASQALGLGANLYLSSYSRDQENEADTLGLRYMTRGGYAPAAVPSFLHALHQQSQLEARRTGNGNTGQASYFSSHPATQTRLNKTRGEAAAYPQKGRYERQAYLDQINNMTYGDSAKQGFVRGQSFFHPGMDFTFTVPAGFKMTNRPAHIVSSHKNGSVIIFDMAGNKNGLSAKQYLTGAWLKDTALKGVEAITINGLPAATAAFSGQVAGKPVTIRVVAIRWKDRFARFQIAIPKGTPAPLLQQLKKATYSFRGLNASEKAKIKPHRLRLYTARSGDSVASIARRMPFKTLQEETFRILNGLTPTQSIKAGQVYKIVSER